ncbi:MAG: BrnT family toxin [Candidatus Eremiobacterota bacterium]
MQKISSIKWTRENINHISKHNVIPEEVEEVCFNEYERPFIKTGREGLSYVLGQTESGRYLFLVMKFLKRGQVKLITARDMNEWERKYYQKNRR